VRASGDKTTPLSREDPLGSLYTAVHPAAAAILPSMAPVYAADDPDEFVNSVIGKLSDRQAVQRIKVFHDASDMDPFKCLSISMASSPFGDTVMHFGICVTLALEKVIRRRRILSYVNSDELKRGALYYAPFHPIHLEYARSLTPDHVHLGIHPPARPGKVSVAVGVANAIDGEIALHVFHFLGDMYDISDVIGTRSIFRHLRVSDTCS
jgi:hypothetical protein